MKTSILILLVAASAGLAATVPAAQFVTASAAGPASISGGGNSMGPAISDDGRRVAFVSHARNLVTNEASPESLQVFVRDLSASNTVLVSVGGTGRGAAGNSIAPMLSSNGQFVVFASDAGDLVPGDTNGASDVFVRDLASATTRLVSVSVAGRAPDETDRSAIALLSGNPLISADGRWVFFESRATGLTSMVDTNAATDVFRRDLELETTELVTRSLTLTQTANAGSVFVGATPDGQRVAFLSPATDVAAGVSNILGKVPMNAYVRDMASGVTFHASASLTNHTNGYDCVSAALSENGRFVAFAVSPSDSSLSPLYLRDLEAAAPVLIAPNVLRGSSPQISSDGRYVAFEDGTNVLRVDTTTGTSELVNVAMAGGPPSAGIARRPVATPDGNGVVFISNAPELVTNGSSLFQIYARDMAAGITRLITAATNGQPSITNSELSLVTVARDFSRIAFDAAAPDLVAADENRASDVFVRELSGAMTTLVSSRDAALPRASGLAHTVIERDCVSADGRFIAFLSCDNELLPGDSNARLDLFVRDTLTGAIVAPGFPTNAARAPAISADGRYAVYLRRHSPFSEDAIGGAVWRFDRQVGTNELVVPSSGAVKPVVSTDGNLIAWETDSFPQQVLLRNMAAGTNYLVSANPSGFESSGNSGKPLLTADSRWVAFESRAPDLAGTLASGYLTLYARDLRSNKTYQVNVGPNGSPLPGGYDSGTAALSGDSRHVVFSSSGGDVYVYNLVTHASVLADNLSRSPALSFDGRHVAYVKRPNGGNVDQVYARDLQNTQTDLVSVSIAGSPADGSSSHPLLSGDGRFVVFESRAGDLVPNDTNGANDIFVRDRVLGVTMLISANAQGRPANGHSSRPVLAADGRTVVFQSFASDLAGGDYNDKRDVFILKLGSADTDGDGIDDDWEIAYLGNLSRDGGGDLDGDGVSDLAEFRAGTDPTNSNSVFRVLTVTPAGGGSTRVMWTGNPSRTYRVEFKDDLGAANWTVVNGTVSWNGSTASIIDATAANRTHRSYRAVRMP